MFRLLELEVVHWDFWRRFRLPLDAPIVTIVGPNGSGKTTLLDALRTLLALDCSKKREYKRYVRRNGEDFCWLRGVIDNQRPIGSSRRPFGLPYQQDQMTLACRIDRKGGDWVRKYWVAEGDVGIEAIESAGQEFGVREYQRLLQSAGLSPAIARVLSLEQGQTDKLCELSARDLLDLVFQVFGDKEVLDRYQEARHHQELTLRELKGVEDNLKVLDHEVQSYEQRVNRFKEWRTLNDERTRLTSEIRPRLEYYLLSESARSARVTLAGHRRESRSKRMEKVALNTGLEDAHLAIEHAVDRKDAADAAEQTVYQELSAVNRELGGWEKLVEQHEALLKAAAEAGGDTDTDARELDRLERRRDELRLKIAALKAEKDQLIDAIENLAAGRRADPADVATFRRALSDAGIEHDLLVDLVELADPSWQQAVEAVLAPFAHIVILGRERDAERAFALGERHRYRHFIVPDRVSAPLAPAGSLLEVVHFAKPIPEWLLRLLERTQRVEDPAAGAKLPRGQDWVTRLGYLRERRGGRHAAPDQARFGAGRLNALKERLESLEQELGPLADRLADVAREAKVIQGRLAGVNATAQLALRAAEFAEARAQAETLTERRRDIGRRAQLAREAREEAEAELAAARTREDQLKRRLADLDREIAEKENRSARIEQNKRCMRLRHDRRRLRAASPTWVEREANRALAEKWRDTFNIQRRVEEIEYRFANESWETDETVMALRDLRHEDYQRQHAELAARRRDNEIAGRQTEAARGQYMEVLRHTVRRYTRNLKTLGETANIKVDHEPPALSEDDVALSQAGLVVKFDFDDKGYMGMNDGDASGGQQVMKSLILLVALMMEESRPGGFVFIDEPFAHLDIVNIERVAAFLKATRAQYLLTTPVTHNVNVYDPAMLTLVTFKKRQDEPWAPKVGVLVREPAAAEA